MNNIYLDKISKGNHIGQVTVNSTRAILCTKKSQINECMLTLQKKIQVLVIMLTNYFVFIKFRQSIDGIFFVFWKLLF